MSNFPEEDLVFVVWSNTNAQVQGRPFETMTKSQSRFPVAWRLSYLQTRYAALYPQAHLVFSEDDLRSWMSPPLNGTVSRQNPLLVPVSFARSVLGWSEFTVWDGDFD